MADKGDGTTSYAGLQLLCLSLILLVGLTSALAPTLNSYVDTYQTKVATMVIAFAPVLVITHRTWFRVTTAIFLVAWAYFVIASLAWGGVAVDFLILPIPLIVAWFLRPATCRPPLLSDHCR